MYIICWLTSSSPTAASRPNGADALGQHEEELIRASANGDIYTVRSIRGLQDFYGLDLNVKDEVCPGRDRGRDGSKGKNLL